MTGGRGAFHTCPTSGRVRGWSVAVGRSMGRGFRSGGVRSMGGTWGGNCAKCAPQYRKTGIFFDEMGQNRTSVGVGRGIFAQPPGAACEHAPRSVAAALACEWGNFLRIPLLIFSTLARLVAMVTKTDNKSEPIFTK